MYICAILSYTEIDINTLLHIKGIFKECSTLTCNESVCVRERGGDHPQSIAVSTSCVIAVQFGL